MKIGQKVTVMKIGTHSKLVIANKPGAGCSKVRNLNPKLTSSKFSNSFGYYDTQPS